MFLGEYQNRNVHSHWRSSSRNKKASPLEDMLEDHLKKKGTKDQRFCASVLLTEQLVGDTSKASIKMGFTKGNKNIKRLYMERTNWAER